MSTKLTCLNCNLNGCNNGKKECFPEFCITKATDQKRIDNAANIYLGDNIDADIMKAAIEIDSEFYCQYTRVEETIAFAHRIGAKKIGLAYCVALQKEAKIFASVARNNGLEVVGVICKVGGIDKCDIGFEDDIKHNPGHHEPICNPILQADYLNRENTQLNILIGLCVGHDSIFTRYSKVPVTTLVVKDRILAHNAAGALYNADSFYKDKLKSIKLRKE